MEDEENLWQNAKSIFLETAERVPSTRPYRLRKWMTEETWSLIEKMREAKCVRDRAQTRSQKTEVALIYNNLINQVKRLCKRDKCLWYQDMTSKAEPAAKE